MKTFKELFEEKMNNKTNITSVEIIKSPKNQVEGYVDGDYTVSLELNIPTAQYQKDLKQYPELSSIDDGNTKGKSITLYLEVEIELDIEYYDKESGRGVFIKDVDVIRVHDENDKKVSLTQGKLFKYLSSYLEDHKYYFDSLLSDIVIDDDKQRNDDEKYNQGR